MRTQLGLEIENSANRTNGIELSAIFEKRVHQIAAAICNQDYRGHICCGTASNGVAVILIGESYRSRAIGVHSEDPPGVIYILEDNGKVIDMSNPAIAQSAVWLSSLTGRNGYTQIDDMLELDRHRNYRLENAQAIR